jgi:hypothetical protein
MILTGALIGLALISLAGLALDDRTVLGAPVWLKPLKFAMSFAAYAIVLAWFVSLVRRGRRFAWWMGAVIAVFSMAEVGLIVFQAARGRQSHFNNATPLDATIFSLMGATIAVVWVATLLIAVLLMRQRMGDAVTTWTIRLGLIIALVGMALGFLMVVPTEEQLASDVDTVVGAHSVGVADGGAGMALTGWSSTGGDLRIPHFVGMHALQALPLLGILLGLLAGRLPRLRDGRVRLRLVLVASAAYVGFLALTTWQALRGQPLLSPDGATLAAAGLLAIATAIGVVVALRPTAPAPIDEQIGVYG